MDCFTVCGRIPITTFEVRLSLMNRLLHNLFRRVTNSEIPFYQFFFFTKKPVRCQIMMFRNPKVTDFEEDIYLI